LGQCTRADFPVRGHPRDAGPALRDGYFLRMRVALVVLVGVALAGQGCARAERDSKSTATRAEPLVAAGALAAPRRDFAWTLMKAGWPFLCGGYDDSMAMSDSLIISEAFDVPTLKWSRLKNSQYGHAGHTVTYLSSIDRILLVGGNPNELYDATLNKWVDE